MRKVLIFLFIVTTTSIVLAQENPFIRYKNIFYEFSPYAELNNEEELNNSNLKIKSIVGYSSKYDFTDNFTESDLSKDNIPVELLYKSSLFEFDTLGRLISYNDFDEKGNIVQRVEKRYKKDSIVRITKNFQESFEAIDTYVLNSKGLPILMSNGDDYLIKYTYKDSNIKIEIFDDNELDLTQEFKFRREGNIDVVESFIDNKKSFVSYYSNATGILLKHLMYNRTVQKVDLSNFYSYNNKDNLIKEISIRESERGIKLLNDRTLLYNKEGRLHKELEYSSNLSDVFVTEYFYNNRGDVLLKFSYKLNKSKKLLGCVKYEYEYFD